METFTIVTGLAGVLGLVLQIKDMFPEHRETRQALVLLVLGVFLGSLIAGLLGTRWTFVVPVTPFHALIAGLGVLLATIVASAIFSSDAAKRETLFAAAGIGVFVFLLVLLFGAAMRMESSKSPTVDELLVIYHSHLDRRNYSRALELLAEAMRQLPRDDSRREALRKRIEEVKALQVRP